MSKHPKIDAVLKEAFGAWSAFDINLSENNREDDCVDYEVSMGWNGGGKTVHFVLREYLDPEHPVEMIQGDDFSDFNTEDLPTYCLIMLLEEDE
jgi:hypothetical protein